MQASRSSASRGSKRTAVSRRRAGARARAGRGAAPESVLAAVASPARVIAQADTSRDAASGGAAPVAAPPAASDTGKKDPEANSGGGVTIDDRGIIIQKGSKRVRIEGLEHDRDYDSFEQFVQEAPWLAGLVFCDRAARVPDAAADHRAVIWYKMRKNRMRNETMLKLAERGVVPPAEAMEAVAPGNAAAVARRGHAAGVPLYEQARRSAARAVWSDLRKGVILTRHRPRPHRSTRCSTTARRTASAWCCCSSASATVVLWYFEDRTREPRRDTSATPPPGGA